MRGASPNKKVPFLPDIPISKEDWHRLRSFLSEFKTKFENYVQNPNPPDQVQQPEAEALTGGINLTWLPSNRATGYAIYRAMDSLDINDAEIIGYIPHGAALKFFDPSGQGEAANVPCIPVTSFSDDFNRASGVLGMNWIVGTQPHTPVVNNINAQTASIGVSTQDAAQAMLVATIGSTNPSTVWKSFLLPIPPLLGLYGADQFSEWKLVKHVATGANPAACGPAVLLRAGGQLDCYFIQAATDTGLVRLHRANGTTLTALTTGFAYAAGDVLRVSAVVGVSSVDFVIKQNGVVKETYSDTSGSRLTVGSPSFYINIIDNSGGGSASSEWRNFSCGPA